MYKLKVIVIIITINAFFFASIFFLYKFVFDKGEYPANTTKTAYKTDYRLAYKFSTRNNELIAISYNKSKTYVLDNRGVSVYGIDKKEEKRFDMAGEFTALWAYNDEIIVGCKDRIRTYDKDGNEKSIWQNLGSNALITSIAVTEQYVFAADAGNKIVYKYDRSGKLLAMIGNNYLIPGPHFDLTAGKDSTIWITDPGRHKVAGYDFTGNKKYEFGSSSADIEGFQGCCNPVNIAVNADGDIITSEKGIPRIKEYTPEGVLKGVVANEDAFGNYKEDNVFDIACDEKGRVIVLDNNAKSVIVYERTER